jgi:hypothetical protein
MQTSSKPVRQLTARIGIKKGAQLRLAPRVRIVGDPRLDDLNQATAIRSSLGRPAKHGRHGQ